MDLERTGIPELEQDGHDPEGLGDQSRRTTSDLWVPLHTLEAVQAQMNGGNMREREALSATLEL